MRSNSAVILSAAALIAAVEAQNTNLPFQSKASEGYLVDSKIPGVPFELGPSDSDPKKFYFWMFPAEGEVGKDDLTIWLNGGPGCSSLEGLLQENGPISLPYNSTEVFKNDYSWTKLSNVLYVDQPVSVGFSTGNSTATSQDEVSNDFRDFLDSFMEVFPELKGKKLWLTGESYAGKYIPYIADKIYQRSDSVNSQHGINLQGISVGSPDFVDQYVGLDAPSLEFALDNNQYLKLNDSEIQTLKDNAEKNGMTDFIKLNLQYPPKGPIQYPSNRSDEYFPWTDITAAAREINPNFNIYNIKDSVPIYDPLGFAPAVLDPSADNFVNNQEGFKKAIHADENKVWLECINGVLDTDNSLPPAESVLPGVISKNARTIIQHGILDHRYIWTGSLFGIQNMTWGDKQGFQSKPEQTIVIDGKTEGIVHTERLLTWVQAPEGHMLPQDSPAFSFKLQKFLLGQITQDDLSK